MSPYLPPTQALRAFEAAARHLSYSRAAEELSLTHDAISHHISRLEQDLGGVRLFLRSGQRMALTEAGQVLALDVRRGLRWLADGMDRVRARGGHSPERCVLTVSVVPSFAARWLVPRLRSFQRIAPYVDIAIRPTTALAPMDDRDGVDLAIRYGPGRWPGLRASKILPGTVFPVCSPGFLGEYGLRAPEDLGRVPLLRSPRQSWETWFRAAGLDWAEPTQGTSYDDAGLLLQAAADGQGVALARAILALDDLAAGRLVRLFDVSVEDEYAWHLVWREPIRRHAAEHETLRLWLLHELPADGRSGPRAEPSPKAV